VMHGDAPDVDDLVDMLGAVYPREDIIVTQIGAVIGTHGGPRIIGVTFHVPK
jgi:fatty acid-binding protein DegV